MEYSSVYITTSDQSEALRIGATVVEEKLAACANIIDGVTSLYIWEGALQQCCEACLLLKTRTDLLGKLIARVKFLHSYEVPGVVVWPISDGNVEYLNWVKEMTLSEA